MPEIIEMGVWALLGLVVLFGIAMLASHIFAQRSQQHLNETSHASLISMISMGVNAIVGSNGMNTVDKAIEHKPKT